MQRTLAENDYNVCATYISPRLVPLDSSKSNISRTSSRIRSMLKRNLPQCVLSPCAVVFFSRRNRRIYLQNDEQNRAAVMGYDVDVGGLKNTVCGNNCLRGGVFGASSASESCAGQRHPGYGGCVCFVIVYFH